jgi:hypothetical protein
MTPRQTDELNAQLRAAIEELRRERQADAEKRHAECE